MDYEQDMKEGELLNDDLTLTGTGFGLSGFGFAKNVSNVMPDNANHPNNEGNTETRVHQPQPPQGGKQNRTYFGISHFRISEPFSGPVGNSLDLFGLCLDLCE